MSDAGFHVDPYAAHGLDSTRVNANSTSAPAEQFLIQANTEFAAGQYREAMRAVMHAVLEDPQDLSLRFWLSQCNLAEGDYGSAAKELRFAMEHQPAEQWRSALENVRSHYGADRESYFRHLNDLANACREESAQGGMYLLLAFHQLDSNNSGAAAAIAAKAGELDAEIQPIADRLVELIRQPTSQPQQERPTFLPANGDPEEMELLPQPAR